MYGLSDQSNIIPLTRFRALRQGSSRYSGATRSIIRTHVRQERIVTLPTQTRHQLRDTLAASGGWTSHPHPGWGCGGRFLGYTPTRSPLDDDDHPPSTAAPVSGA